MNEMESIWINTHSNNSNSQFWYVDYENHIAKRSDQKPIFESIKKYEGSIEQFLSDKGIEIKNKGGDTIQF